MFLAFVLFVFVATASARSQGLNALQEIEFSGLSQRDPNPLGEKALAINPDQWKHGETDHFIYHFVHSYVVTPVSIEAEFHYRVIAKELGREQPAGDTKSHIYVFERPEDWRQFQSLGELEPWTGASIPRVVSLLSAIPLTNLPITVSDTRLCILFCTAFILTAFRVG